MAEQRTWLIKLRETRGASQEELALRVGVDTGTYGRWERGIQGIRNRNFAALAEVFGLSLRQLLEVAGETKQLPASRDRSTSRSHELVLDPISSLRAIVDGYRGLDHSIGPEGMLDVVGSKLLITDRLGQLARTSADRQRLLLLTAEVHQLGGWMQFDLRDMPAARQSFAVARSIAAEADAPDLLAFVLGPSAAFAEADSGNPIGSVDLAYAALGHAQRSNNQRLIAFAHAIAARIHAKLGDERLALESIEKSAVALALHDGWDQDPVWLHVFDETALAGHSGSVELDLGRAQSAVDLLDRQDAASEEIFVRNRAIWRLDRARAYRDLGELDQACEEVMSALDLVSATSSVRTEHKLVSLAQTLTSERGGAVASRLREVVADRVNQKAGHEA